jgi:hypothetical protein
MAEIYLITNGAVSGAAQQVKVATGTAIITLLQVKLGLTANRAKVIEWGISFDGSAAATPISVELVETSLAATVTAHLAAGIAQLDPLGTTPTTGNPFTFTTITTGYTGSVENAASGTFRPFDVQLIAPTNQYVKQWPLGREPMMDQTKYLRIRVTAGTTVNAFCYVVIEV